MYSLHLTSLALALLCAPTTLALTIDVPSTIAAGQPVQVNITNDMWNSTSSFDARFDTYKLNLVMSQNHTVFSDLYQSCWFINNTALPDSNITTSITIPASVGPAGSYYKLTTGEWNSSESTTWISETDRFDLTGATGAWSQGDLEGYLPYNKGDVPCSSLACVKACQNQVDQNEDEDEDDYEIASLILCIESCDNVPIADYLLDEVDSAALSSASASFAATHTATTSATSATATSATLTALSSGAAQSSGSQPSATAKSGAAGPEAVSMLLIVAASCSTLKTFL